MVIFTIVINVCKNTIILHHTTSGNALIVFQSKHINITELKCVHFVVLIDHTNVY